MSGKYEDHPWDLLDRCCLPILLSHGFALILSFFFNLFNISQISFNSLFLSFLLISIGVVIFYHNLKVSIAGKCVLITSCDNQIGYSLARQLDDIGFTVYAGFSDVSQGQKLKDVSSGRLHILQLDITSEKQIKNAYDYIHQNLPLGTPGLWAIVNNTTWAVFGQFHWLPIEVYKKSIDINLIGVMQISRTFLPSLRKTSGRIINVSSIAGHIPSDMRSSLCIVKSALESLSDCLRIELRKFQIDLVVVECGTYTTAMWFNEKKLLQDAKEMWANLNKEELIFGQDYFEYKIRSLPEYRPNDKEINMNTVTRSLVDSINRTFPLAKYSPIGKREKVQLFLWQHFPSSIYNIIYK